MSVSVGSSLRILLGGAFGGERLSRRQAIEIARTMQQNNKRERSSSTTMRREASERTGQRWMVALLVGVLSCWTPAATAFLRPAGVPSSKTQHESGRSSATQLAFNRWGSFGDFLNTNRTQAAATDYYLNSSDDDSSTEETAAGTLRLVTLPVQDMKPGGLRLFLMFYLMGLQNTPDRLSWKADQPSADEYVVEMYFHDRTGVLSVELTDDKVTVDRVGSAPSTQYLMQESIVVQGILEELEKCANDDSIAVKDRLLVLEDDDDSIEKARGALAFG